ncbi:MAG: PAS domain S-box protein [Ignavibacteria bacterium]|jgi:PAS domain S-box-containing protein
MNSKTSVIKSRIFVILFVFLFLAVSYLLFAYHYNKQVNDKEIKAVNKQLLLLDSTYTFIEEITGKTISSGQLNNTAENVERLLSTLDINEPADEILNSKAKDKIKTIDSLNSELKLHVGNVHSTGSISKKRAEISLINSKTVAIQKHIKDIKTSLAEDGQVLFESVDYNNNYLYGYFILSVLLSIVLVFTFITSTRRKVRLEEKDVNIDDLQNHIKYFYEKDPLLEFNVNFDGIIVEANRAFIEHFGYNRKAIIGKHIKTITDESEIETLERNARRCFLRPGKVITWEICRVRKNGNKVWLKESGRAVKDADGNKVLLIDAKDITVTKVKDEKIHLSDLILQNVAALILVVDSGSKVKYVSPSVEKILGYKPEELLEEGWWEKTWYTPNERNEEFENAKKRARGDLPVAETTYERFIKRKDAKPCRILWQETKGPNDLLIGVGYDITENMQVQKELKESKERYKELFNSIGDSIFITDMEHKIIEANQTAFRKLSVTKDELLNKKMKNIISSEFHYDEDELLRGLKKNKNKLIETEFVVNDKKSIAVELSNNLIDYEGAPAVLSIARDITDRKKIEERIKILSLAIEQSPVSVVITDVKGNINYINKQFVEVTGYTREEVLGKNINIQKSGKTPREVYKELWETILKGKSWYGELYNKKKNGELFWESTSISPIKDDRGKVVHFVAIKKDITENKEYQQKLKSAKEKAEEMTRLKSVFLNNMSHELRTPLIGIIGYAEILYEEINEKELSEIAGHIYKGGKRLTTTLNSILDLSKIESNELPLNIVTNNINDLLKETINNFHEEISKKGLSFNNNFVDNPVVYAKVDERLFKDVISNLLDNAVKYTETGSITIEANYDAKEPENYTIVKISDTGIGIPEKYHRQIFEPFRQISEGDNRSFEGIGLGLAVAKKFLEVMNGKICLSSRVGMGSAFMLKLPR